MDIRFPREPLTRALSLANNVADRRGTMPILAHVLLRTDGAQKALVGATDMSVSLVVEIAADVRTEGGVAINAKALCDVVKELEGEHVDIKRLDNQWVEIRAGKAEFKLAATADRDFPKLPNPHEAETAPIETSALGDTVTRVVVAASTDETRPHINGVLLHAHGGSLLLVATDGHRLAHGETSWDKGLTIDPGVIVPRKGVLEMKRVLEDAGDTCRLGIHQGNLFLRTGDTSLAVKLADAQFPPYDKVIPKDNEKKVAVDRQRLLSVLRRISTVTMDRTHGVRVELSRKGLHVSSDEPDKASGRETLDVEYAGAGTVIGFNAHYLIELLDQVPGDEVTMEISGELDPALFRPVGKERYLAVVMPMRI